MSKEVIYGEGFVILMDKISIFHFKNINTNFILHDMIQIIDMYDNMVKIPIKNIWYIFYHANNIQNEGCKI